MSGLRASRRLLAFLAGFDVVHLHLPVEGAVELLESLGNHPPARDEHHRARPFGLLGACVDHPDFGPLHGNHQLLAHGGVPELGCPSLEGLQHALDLLCLRITDLQGLGDKPVVGTALGGCGAHPPP